MEMVSAQREMSDSHAGGAPGVVVSGVVWLIAAYVERAYGMRTGFAALFAGGILIFPVSVMICRLMFRTPKVARDNPLERLAIEGTAMLFAGILAGYVLLYRVPALAFAVVALAIGARYFTFRSLYDEPLYWALGGLVAIVATIALLHPAVLPLGVVPLVGLVECVFGATLFVRWKARRGQALSAATLRS